MWAAAVLPVVAQAFAFHRETFHRLRIPESTTGGIPQRWQTTFAIELSNSRRRQIQPTSNGLWGKQCHSIPRCGLREHASITRKESDCDR
jgi:hypothetical protein